MKASPSPAPLLLGLAVFAASTGFVAGQMMIDFNSNQSGGGTPLPGDPTDPAGAVHHEAGYQCYHASHEVIADFLPATYDVNFTVSGAATVTMTPEWPNSSANTVQQSIGRSQGQADTWIGERQNLLRDWIGVDARTGQGGNGTWDGAFGTPTYMTLTFSGLPSGPYAMTTFHHDVENMNSFFTIEVSTDGGTTFSVPIEGRMTNSLGTGTPAENIVFSGTPPNIAGGDPADLSSTQNFTFTAAAGSDVVLRFTPLPPGDAGPVHNMFFGLNGFHLDQAFSPDDMDGDELPDAWEEANGLDPNSAVGDDGATGDPDGDGVDNETEFADGTHPKMADTDGDGLNDGAEKTAGSNPLNPDSDGDTLTDGDEVNVIGTSPIDPDTDDDYFLDPTEVALGSGTDAAVYPISPDGLLIDFSSNAINGQAGTFHDQGRQPYVADHEVDFSVDRSETYPVPGFGAGTEVTLAVDFPDGPVNTVKQMIGRGAGNVANYTGNDAALARDWIGVDARLASGGNGFETPTRIRFTLTGLPAGAYLYRSFHHDVENQRGGFDVLIRDANNPESTLIGSRSMTATGNGSNPAPGAPVSTMPSTFVAVITSDGSNPVEIIYQGTEADDGAGGTIVPESFVGINGFDLVPTDDQDGDGMPDDYEDANGLDKTRNDAAEDLDDDGLTNFAEFDLGTKPNNPDTDADGALDGAELAAGSDPFVQDTDGDGLLDGDELALGADPTNTDSDGDGYLDGADPDPVDGSKPSPSETLVAYWPLDGTDGVVTPDTGPNGYDMTLNNMSAANFITDDGRKAAQFENFSNTMLTYVANPGDDLPINQHAAFTVAMWVRILGSGQNDLRFFSEGSTATNDPLFNMGTRNDGADDSFDLYLRDGGTPNHQYSNSFPLDDTWRHLALTFNTNTQSIRLYVDGTLDKDDWVFRDVNTSLNTTSIGGILRAAPSHWITGLIDDVAVWKRILDEETIAELASGTPPDSLGGPGFAITEITRDPNTGFVTVTWNSKPGKLYVLRYSDTLEGDPTTWLDLDDSIPSEGASTSFTDVTATDDRRFYVVEEF